MGRSTLHIILFHILVAFSIVHLPVLSQVTNQQDLVGVGIKAEAKVFPYLAALEYRNTDSVEESPQFRYLCGGSLISPRHVLTAADCVKNGDNFHVLLGATDLNNPGDKAQRIEIDRIVSHPEYKPNLYYNNVAVLILKSDAVINSFVKPIRFHVTSLQATSTASKKFQAIGFGINEDDTNDYVFMTRNVRILPRAECQREYGYSSKLVKGIDDTLICAGYLNISSNSDTFVRDIGGPLIMMDALGSDPLVLVGISAFGKQWTSNVPDVYTATFPYLDWIDGLLRMH